MRKLSTIIVFFNISETVYKLCLVLIGRSNISYKNWNKGRTHASHTKSSLNTVHLITAILHLRLLKQKCIHFYLSTHLVTLFLRHCLYNIKQAYYRDRRRYKKICFALIRITALNFMLLFSTFLFYPNVLFQCVVSNNHGPNN